jgi:hypothetical protein
VDDKIIEKGISKPVDKNKQSSIPAAKETNRDGRFIAYNDGTVLDAQTNLMWAEKDNGSDIKWRNAKSYCKNYRGGGYTDWRLPTQNELAGLYDASKKKNRYGARITDLIKITSWWIWASEKIGSEASVFLFNDGRRYSLLLWEGTAVRTLPVRSVK